MNEHTLRQFDADMEAIRTMVLNMGGLVEQQLLRAINSIKSGNDEVSKEALVEEERINSMEMEIDQLCSQIISRRQPAAVDLRMIMTFLKTANDLERIGDEAKKVTTKGQEIHNSKRVTVAHLHELTWVSQTTRQMVQKALDALARLDVKAAAEVLAEDEKVDAEFVSIVRQMASYMMEDPRTISVCIEIVLIAKAIERIGDHAKNISEYVVHAVKGKDVRHASLAEIQQEIGSG
ncbi:MAG TPA: phosphate signaling complex protein PhoU [Burkholderiales bacterium]|nr:phosphate signaling complex protein PhoU [Burkholderiales bacterium]